MVAHTSWYPLLKSTMMAKKYKRICIAKSLPFFFCYASRTRVRMSLNYHFNARLETIHYIYIHRQSMHFTESTKNMKRFHLSKLKSIYFLWWWCSHPQKIFHCKIDDTHTYTRTYFTHTTKLLLFEQSIRYKIECTWLKLHFMYKITGKSIENILIFSVFFVLFALMRATTVCYIPLFGIAECKKNGGVDIAGKCGIAAFE